MTLHVFVDESMRRGEYLMSATYVEAPHLSETRAAMRSLLLRGQRRLHMTDESDRRRRSILSAISELDVTTRIYVAPGGERAGRPPCLRQVVVDALGSSVSRLVIESGGIRDHRDRLLVHEELTRRQPTIDPSYEHLRSAEEPLLWVPDAVLWAWGARRDWRRRVTVEAVVRT